MKHGMAMENNKDPKISEQNKLTFQSKGGPKIQETLLPWNRVKHKEYAALILTSKVILKLGPWEIFRCALETIKG